MTTVRICDVDDCEEDAGFMVGAWSEDGTELNETGDVCSPKHAKEWTAQWLRDFADVEVSV